MNASGSEQAKKYVLELLDEAAAAAGKLTDAAQRAEALDGILAARTRLDGRGRRDFTSALAELDRVENVHERPSVMREIAEDMAKDGQFDAALGLAAEIDDFFMREWTWIVIADAQAKAGRHDAALSTAERITDTHYLARGMASVARGMAAAGDARAVAAIDRALSSAAEIDDPYDRAWVLCAVAEAAESAGTPIAGIFDHALEAVHEVCVTVKRTSALRAVGAAMGRAGDPRAHDVLALALESAEALESADGKASALGWAAAAFAKAGSPDARKIFGAAVRTAAGITDSGARDRATRWIAASLAEAGNPGEAVALAKNVNLKFFRFDAYKDIALALARQGDFDRASQTIRRINDPKPFIEALKAVALELADI